jgi:hypothetical protein
MSLPQEIVDFVNSRCTTTNSEVLAAIGNKISVSIAATIGRTQVRTDVKRKRGSGTRSTASSLIARGKRQIISEVLKNLCKRGKIRRISRGLYAPIKPKLFKAS